MRTARPCINRPSLPTRDVNLFLHQKKTQIHPTGFVDPSSPTAPTKTLCAELLRGAGAVLLTRDGRRFADELGTRDYVVGRMLHEADLEQGSGGLGKGTGVSLQFALVLNEKGALETEKHVALYLQKGLLQKITGVARVASWLKRTLGGDKVVNDVARAHRNGRSLEWALRQTLVQYDAAAAHGVCPLTNKTHFHNAPFIAGLEKPGSQKQAGPVFYVGRVTPVTHYTMGGVRVDTHGRVMRNPARAQRTGQQTVPGLFAAGELIGGVHGKNRLGGNALTECAVFGRRVGRAVRLAGDEAESTERDAIDKGPEETVGEVRGEAREEAVEEVREEAQEEEAQEEAAEEATEDVPEDVPEDVQDPTEEAMDEPEGETEEEQTRTESEDDNEETTMIAETETTTMNAESETETDEEESSEDDSSEDASNATVTRAELASHATEHDCWVALYGLVYDFSTFLEDHPAGAESIARFAGTDGTAGFHAVHDPGMLDAFEAVGTLVD